MSPATMLKNALILAILAPDRSRRNRAIRLAAEISKGCTTKQIASAKRASVKLTAK